MKSNDPECYFAASAAAAVVNYPLWKASAINQSGFIPLRGNSDVASRLRVFAQAVSPPYRGVPAVLFGMTWARAAIFYGSDRGRAHLEEAQAPRAVAMGLPPLLLSSLVQCVNMPIVRASITMQDPSKASDPRYANTLQTLRHLARTKGVGQLWHGLSAGLGKSVPKYLTAVVVKDSLELALPPASDDFPFLARAVVKAVAAGLAGAVLTNPMDVIRNEMFKTDKGFADTVRTLCAESRGESRGAEGRGAQGARGSGWGWMRRGLGSNVIAVSFPITLTIFLGDVLVQWKHRPQDVAFRRSGGPM